MPAVQFQTPSSISLDEFRSILSRYANVLKRVSDHKQPKKPNKDAKSLEEIDQWRDGIAIAVRKAPASKDEKKKKKSDGISSTTGGALSLGVSDVKEIVSWKLKRGKFRPTILPLVSSNKDVDIEDTVRKAINSDTPAEVTTHRTKADDEEALSQVLSMIKTLTALKGIGPATATAILAAIFPSTIPFLSDEAFRWIMSGEDGNAGTDWDRKIKYDIKEYTVFFTKVRDLSRRLMEEAVNASESIKVFATDVEKVGWVLGQEAALGINVTSDDEPRSSSIHGKEPKKEIAGSKLSGKVKVDKAVEAHILAEVDIVEVTDTGAKRKKGRDVSPPPLRRSKRNKDF